jgi:SAM-dependent methyltransferase
VNAWPEVADEPEYLGLNRAWWDERAPIHADSEFYDLDGFVAGHDTLLAFEDELVGPVEGLDLVHLQCHMGMDTLSWARRGARVTGLDFSQPAIETARSLAERIGVDARFEVADVYDAVEVLGQTYDLAYQSLGSLVWHPDMARWAGILADLVRPGGRYVLLEGHPMAWVLDDAGEEVEQGYFGSPEGRRWRDAGGTYADMAAPTEHNETIEFSHTLSDVIQSLLDAGFVLERFVEHPFTVFEMWPWLEMTDGQTKTWTVPEGRPSLPMMFSVVARRSG